MMELLTKTLDISLFVSNRQCKPEEPMLCYWCDPLKQLMMQNSSNSNIELLLRDGLAFDSAKNEDASYVCKVLRILLPHSLTVYKKWSFDSTIETYYPVLSRRRFILLIRLLEVIALKLRRYQGRLLCLFELGISEMVDLDCQNVHDNRKAKLKRKFLLPNQALEIEVPKDFQTEFKHNFHCLVRWRREIAIDHWKPQPSLKLCSLNQRLLTAHQCLWNGLSTHFDCIRELCDVMSEPPITISEIKTFLCYLLDCDESNEVVQDICFEYETELPFYQPKTLSELSQYAVLQSLRKAETLPHGLNHLCIPNRLKRILMM